MQQNADSSSFDNMTATLNPGQTLTSPYVDALITSPVQDLLSRLDTAASAALLPGPTQTQGRYGSGWTIRNSLVAISRYLGTTSPKEKKRALPSRMQTMFWAAVMIGCGMQ